MISRLTLAAAVFAVLGTASLTFATEAPAGRTAGSRQAVSLPAATSAMPVIVLPRIEVIGKRIR